MDIQKICEEVENEYKMGGLSDGLYGDFAKEVARRAVLQEREACANTCEALLQIDGTETAKQFAAAIRMRSNETR